MKAPQARFPQQETRFLNASVEIRAEGDEEKTQKVFGYAAKFNVESENLGGSDWQMRETIMPGAFDDVLKDDVRALFNHDESLILARSKNGEGSLRLGADEVGLWYEFEAPDTQAGRDLMTSISRGDVDQSSFSFVVQREDEDWQESKEGDGPVVATRTIKRVSRLYDVSPVTYPAYPDATVALRSFKESRQESEETPSDEPSENHSIAHRQRALGLIDKPATNN